MNKKGQVTIFIIVGVIVVAIGITLFFVFNSNSKKPLNLEASSVEIFVLDCIESVGKDALYVVGQNGGYYFPPKNSNSLGIAFYFFEGEDIMPSKEVIEKEIGAYLDEALPICTEEFVKFNNFNVSQEKVQSEVFISENKVFLNVNYPIRITKGEDVVFLKKFKDIEIPIRLGEIYSIAKSIIQRQLTNPKEICISCVLELEEKGFLSSIKSEEGAIIYNLFDSHSVSDNSENILEPESYHFRFAIEI